MKVAVMGSGSWGTALAVLLSQNGHEVRLWSYRQAECEALKRDREHKAFLPGVKIPDPVILTDSAQEALVESEAVVLATPSQFVRQTLENCRSFIDGQLLINVAKGLEAQSLKTLAQVVEEASDFCSGGFPFQKGGADGAEPLYERIFPGLYESGSSGRGVRRSFEECHCAGLRYF